MPSSPRHAYWLGRAHRLVWCVNLGWWLARFAPLAFGVTLLGILPLLWARGRDLDGVLLWGVYTALFIAAAFFAAWRARHQFENTTDALARLDNTLSLHNRLTSAHAGVGDWPPIPPEATGGVMQWKLGRAGGLLLSSVFLLLLAAVVRLPALTEPVAAAPEVPPPLADVRTWTRQLREEKVVDPKAIEALEEKAEALLKHPQGDWYKAGALEAAEHLREQTAQTLQNLEKDLAAIEAAVAQAQAFMDKLPEPLAEALQQSLAEALQGLDLSSLPLETLQRDALRNLDMKALTKMTPEQLSALREALKKNRTALAKNGAMKQGGAQKGKAQKQGEMIPAFLFAPEKQDPMDRLLDLVGTQHGVLVRRAFVELSEREREVLQKASGEGRIQAYPEEGADSGDIEGIVFMPGTTAIPGMANASDDSTIDALMSLVLDPAMRSPVTAQQKAAVLKALGDKRLRLGKFSLRDNPSECQNPGAGGAVTVCLRGGQGGPGGGGPSMPLTFNRPPQDIAAKQKETLASKDREHDNLGDVQGIGLGKHKVDQNAYQGPSAGGTLDNTGAGGDAVWIDNLTPEERATLKEYFK